MEDHFEKAEVIEFVQNPGVPLRNRALIAFLFVTAARVSEIVGVVRKEQIRFESIQGREFMVVYDVPVEKRKRPMKRNIPVAIDKEKPFVDVIMKYAGHLKDQDTIFDINRIRAFQICRKVTKKGPHFLRHSRLTNLSSEYLFGPEDLAAFVGWSTWRTAEEYVHLRFKDIAGKMVSR